MTATLAPGAGDERMRSIWPFTGCTRADWAALADRMLGAVRPFASDHHARITPPGPEGGYGRDIDGLEGFARSFRLASETQHAGTVSISLVHGAWEVRLVPVEAGAVRVGSWVMAVVELTGGDPGELHDLRTTAVTIEADGPRHGVTVTWPDAARTRTLVPPLSTRARTTVRPEAFPDPMTGPDHEMERA